jgi:hypothetical protein
MLYGGGLLPLNRVLGCRRLVQYTWPPPSIFLDDPLIFIFYKESSIQNRGIEAMHGSHINTDQSIRRFWDKYIILLGNQGINPGQQRWFVRRVEEYISLLYAKIGNSFCRTCNPIFQYDRPPEIAKGLAIYPGCPCYTDIIL